MHRFRWLPVSAAAVLLATLILMPPERSVGGLLRVIFLHGALVRVAVGLFLLSGLAALVALVKEAPQAWAWTRALQLVALVAWAAGFVISFYPSYVTWGTAIVWAEPRTQMMVRVLVIATLVFGITRWLDDDRLIAVGTLAVGLMVPLLIALTGVIRHPLDPVGTSPSLTLRLTYGLVIASLGVLALWWAAYMVECKA